MDREQRPSLAAAIDELVVQEAVLHRAILAVVQGGDFAGIDEEISDTLSDAQLALTAVRDRLLDAAALAAATDV